MPTQATASDRAQTNQESVIADLGKANPLQLAGVDLASLEPAKVLEFAQAAQARINDAVNGGLLVDKRSGLVYTGGSYIGNVNRPIKALNVIPSAFKVKEDHVARDGNVTLPASNVTKGHDALTTSTVGAIRFLLAGQEGNGINLIGQKAKTRQAAAEAMGTVKGALA